MRRRAGRVKDAGLVLPRLLRACSNPNMGGDDVSSQGPAPLVVRRRGSETECVHRGWMVLVEGERLRAHGDPGVRVFTRSCTKPFQALALLASGAAERFGCTDEEIALACSSHDGSPAHRAVAARMLARAGLEERHLRCGPSEPFGDAARRTFHIAGESPAPLVHNCSGKHAGFLLAQVHLGGAPEKYLEPDSAVQGLARKLVAMALGVPPAELGAYVDGCSAPTFRPPLVALARGFARLANPELAPPEIRDPLTKIRDAIASHPDVYAGPTRLCAALLRASHGAIVPKNGAEGVYAFGVRGRGAGFAIKVEDGATRGYVPSVIATLRASRLLPEGAIAGLRPYSELDLRNAAGAVIGRQELVASL
ncbi:MAG TPA: asparaginase [Planctomycetota bacterium]|nr:asparaginase [Planctomycetota bacterium]